MTQSELLDERVLRAPDVCRNCFGVIRVERIDPTRDGLTREYESSYERHRDNTTVDYGPAEVITEQKGVFCDCGVEEARTRIWDDKDVDKNRFRTLIQTLLRTLEHKGVTVRRKAVAGQALQARKHGASVDEALAKGVDAGLATAASSSSGHSATGD